jgi:hypothetical protein
MREGVPVHGVAGERLVGELDRPGLAGGQPLPRLADVGPEVRARLSTSVSKVALRVSGFVVITTVRTRSEGELNGTELVSKFDWAQLSKTTISSWVGSVSR